ncbi:hypothetical protein ACVWYN_001757 [Pedobacter sp. UYP24]
MKKTLILSCIITCFSLISYAQDNTSYRTTLQKMLKASGAENTYKSAIGQMITMFKQQQVAVPEAFWNEFQTEFDKNSFDDIVTMLLPVYQKHLTEGDLKSMITFYETPTGKKFALVTPSLMVESMQAGQEWGKKMGETVMKRLQEKGYLKQ